MVGKVIGHKPPSTEINGQPFGAKVFLRTKSYQEAILPYEFLFDEWDIYDARLLPDIGQQIETVIFNYVEGKLILSSKPKDLKRETIQEYREFYEFVDKGNEGQKIIGTIKKVMPFGLFVDIGIPFIGLIDFGHIQFNRGKQLPYDYSKWPKEGDNIQCVISYYRFQNKQIGLGWAPD